ncbi:unnamed protein product [Pleuronectes platessa]|uniref:Uncharacterized protein n=1 Tax=Pleuronectes platessa TaxID=8262 RepID=A0A9N7Z8L8_PLEPL|nr:unnamed protein product [Pleuronectes platessa]
MSNGESDGKNGKTDGDLFSSPTHPSLLSHSVLSSPLHHHHSELCPPSYFPPPQLSQGRQGQTVEEKMQRSDVLADGCGIVVVGSHKGEGANPQLTLGERESVLQILRPTLSHPRQFSSENKPLHSVTFGASGVPNPRLPARASLRQGKSTTPHKLGPVNGSPAVPEDAAWQNMCNCARWSRNKTLPRLAGSCHSSPACSTIQALKAQTEGACEHMQGGERGNSGEEPN